MNNNRKNELVMHGKLDSDSRKRDTKACDLQRWERITLGKKDTIQKRKKSYRGEKQKIVCVDPL